MFKTITLGSFALGLAFNLLTAPVANNRKAANAHPANIQPEINLADGFKKVAKPIMDYLKPEATRHGVDLDNFTVDELVSVDGAKRAGEKIAESMQLGNMASAPASPPSRKVLHAPKEGNFSFNGFYRGGDNFGVHYADMGEGKQDGKK